SISGTPPLSTRLTLTGSPDLPADREPARNRMDKKCVFWQTLALTGPNRPVTILGHSARQRMSDAPEAIAWLENAVTEETSVPWGPCRPPPHLSSSTTFLLQSNRQAAWPARRGKTETHRSISHLT